MACSLPVLVAAAVGALFVSLHPSARESVVPIVAATSSAAEAGHVGSRPDAEAPFEVGRYVDPDFDFSLAVPVGWRAVVVAESEAEESLLEPGYAVGFSSPPERAGDPFSDYLMVEILPGGESGLFVTDGSRRREVVIDGRKGWRDELSLPGAPPVSDGREPAGDADSRWLSAIVGASSAGAVEPIDLLAWQATFSGLGYTICFYAIGEPARRSLLDDAFETMLRTFRLPHPPFAVS